MKFTNEEALEKLKLILTNDGKKPLRMSERSIKSQLETLAPIIANDEMELDDFIGKVKVSFETMNSNMEKDNSDFVAKWESEHKTKEEPKNKEEKNKGEETKPSGNPQLDALVELVNGMKKELDDAKKEKSITSKRRELEEAMEKKGIKDKEWRETFLSEISITEDMDIDAKADSYLKIYNKSKSSDTNVNYSPQSSASGNKNKESMFSDIQKDFEREQERNKN